MSKSAPEAHSPAELSVYDFEEAAGRVPPKGVFDFVAAREMDENHAEAGPVGVRRAGLETALR